MTISPVAPARRRRCDQVRHESPVPPGVHQRQGLASRARTAAGRPGSWYWSPVLPGRGGPPRWRPAATRHWPPKTRRRRPPRHGRPHAILESVKVPERVVALTTSDSVIVAAQKALLLDTRPASTLINGESGLRSERMLLNETFLPRTGSLSRK